MVSGRAVTHISEHQAWIYDGGEPLRELPRPSNGLLDPAPPRGAVLYTGINTGKVTMSVEVLDAPPPAVEADGWEEVVEVSIKAHEELT